MMDTAIQEQILFLIPEPKSPHGVDVTPDGKMFIVAGKLDTHASVYDFEKIMKLISKKSWMGGKSNAKIYFASGKTDLPAAAAGKLASMVAVAKGGHKLFISGYNDPSGNAKANAELSKKRAFAVRDALIAAGAPEGSLILKKPANATSGGDKKEARRVEVTDAGNVDAYGIPILDMKASLHGQLSVGLGPLHNQYDSKPCVVYTSIYVDSMVTKWDYCKLKVLDKLHIHYNIGHLMTMEGDSADPQGKYLVALNKLAIDRFNPVGPLHPQNHQLIDISGDKMQLLYDMPVPLGEPHYVSAIRASLLKPKVRYALGTNSRTDSKSAFRTRPGREKIVRKDGVVHVYGTVIRSHITPEIIEAEAGDTISLHLTNVERAEDETHGFAINGHNVNLSIEPGKTVSATFKVPNAGVFPFYCTEFCSALHLEMEGILLVRPKGTKAEDAALKEGTKYTEDDYKKQVKNNVATRVLSTLLSASLRPATSRTSQLPSIW